MLPATVGTSTTSFAVSFGYQRKGFYAEGLFWAFYTNGTNAGWEFTNDPTNWAGAFTSIGACASAQKFSIWFDGTYVHYARYDSNDLFYRRGTPVNDGTITWSQVQQTVYSGSGTDEYEYPCITVDTDGYAWIGVLHDKPDGDDLPVVLKNDNNDGTWALDFATEMSANDSLSWACCVIPLTGGKVYAIYARSGWAPLGNLWNGAAWVGEENTLTDWFIEVGYQFSAVAEGDDVHLVYNRDSTNQIRHNKRVWGVGWDAADVLVQDATTATCGPALSLDSVTGDLYCFWTKTSTDHVYYSIYSAGSWGAAKDWIDESTDDIQFDHLVSSFYQDYGGYFGLLYTTETGSPYKVRFDYPIEEPSAEGGLKMFLSLKGHMGYDMKTREGKARRRMW